LKFAAAVEATLVRASLGRLGRAHLRNEVKDHPVIANLVLGERQPPVSDLLAGAGLVVLGVALIVVGILYLTRTAAELSSFFPGHQAGSSHHHSKHGVLALILGLLALVGDWMSDGRRSDTNPLS
jgi:hypothetical protein